MKNKKLRANGEYYETLKSLKEHLPSKYPVDVRRVNVVDEEDSRCIGTTDYYKKKFYIRISKELDDFTAALILIHEWAHMLVWFIQYDADEHGAEWGIAYAKCWRIYRGEDNLTG